jgi:hypothetical protein
MKYFYKLTTLLLLIFVVGCSTPEEEREEARQRMERAANQQMQARIEEERQKQALREKCSGFGFQPNTTSFAQCLQLESTKREQQVERQNTCERVQDEVNRSNSRCTLDCLNTPGMRWGTPEYARCTQRCDAIYPRRRC